MSKDEEDKSPYGAGFIAACIVVGAVLICGLAVIVVGRGSSQASTVDQRAVSAVSAPQPTDAPATQPAQAPATPVDNPSQSSSVDHQRQTGSCDVPAGDQTVPASAPAADSWEVSRRVVVPRSSKFGPATTDSDGFRHCFAHSPTGALYAAYSAIAATADQTKRVPTVKKLMVPGPATDALLQEVSTEDPSASTESPAQPVGYRIVDAAPDRVSVMLAMPVESVYMSASLTLVWSRGDWRVQPPQPGEAVGAPFAQHRDLDDFVKWSGI
ncbi:hypothetical protein [Kribbella sp. NPDC048928]|uniref:hypothetical protein n=1 Tax=Kribbella sp. NPDC048928 TaxID=3364111 RepID=UPI00371A23AA